MILLKKQNIKDLIKNIIYINRLNKFSNKSKFEYKAFKKEVLTYIDTNKNMEEIYKYKFCNSSNIYELYSSNYALMTYGLFNEINLLNNNQKKEWAKYILSFQKENGLFIDDTLSSPLADKIHYWGWYHLLPHIIIGLDYLNVKPKYDFEFLYNIFEKESPSSWLESRKWSDNYLAVSNEIMNIGVLLQYSRDFMDNNKAKDYIEEIKEWLKQNYIDKKTGLWGVNIKENDIYDITKAVKTTYHIMPLFIYDNDLDDFQIDKILKYTLKTQNFYGTYGPCILTDGCEDIDSVYLLTQLPTGNDKLKNEIKFSLEKFFNKVFINQNEDGGFVFRRIKSFQYADSKLISKPNESNMFGTWFRSLSIAFICNYLKIENDFKFSNVPGYQFNRNMK